MSAAEEELAVHLRAMRINFEREVRFAPPRRWRFDFVLTGRQVAIEVDGGVHNGGRHVRGKGFENDLRKINEAACRGWTVIRVTPGMIRSGEAIRYIERVVAG